jgi:hypothetical protein
MAPAVGRPKKKRATIASTARPTPSARVTRRRTQGNDAQQEAGVDPVSEGSSDNNPTIPLTRVTVPPGRSSGTNIPTQQGPGERSNTPPIPKPRMAQFTHDNKMVGDWEPIVVRRFYDQMDGYIIGLIPRPLPSDVVQIRMQIADLKRTIARLDALHGTGHVTSKNLLQNADLKTAAHNQIAKLQHLLPKEVVASGTDYMRSIQSASVGGLGQVMQIRQDLPYNWDDAPIPYDATLANYTEQLNKHPPPEFSGADGTTTWGQWWSRWYDAVHRYPIQVVTSQTRLQLLIKSLKNPAKEGLFGKKARPATSGDAQTDYRNLVGDLHMSYNIISVSIEKLTTNVETCKPVGKTLQDFRVFLGELWQAVIELTTASGQSEKSHAIGLRTAIKRIDVALYRDFTTTVSSEGRTFNTQEEHFQSLRAFLLQSITRRKQIDEENEFRINLEGGESSENNGQKPVPKPRNNEGQGKANNNGNNGNQGNNGNNGKGATDKPGWKVPAQANFSSFEAKKGRGGGGGDNMIGTKPMPVREFCPFHIKPMKHDPMECRQNIDNKKAQIQKLKLCYNCLGKNHNSAKCFFVKGCTDCNQSHHPSLCPKNQKNPGGNNGGSSNGGRNGGKKWNKKKGGNKQDPKQSGDAMDAAENTQAGNSRGRTMPSSYSSNPNEGHGANTSATQGAR